jgi:hypothetical protein
MFTILGFQPPAREVQTLDRGVAIELSWRDWVAERNAAHERLDEILKRAEREQRDLTPEEAAEADRLERKLRELLMSA